MTPWTVSLFINVHRPTYVVIHREFIYPLINEIRIDWAVMLSYENVTIFTVFRFPDISILFLVYILMHLRACNKYPIYLTCIHVYNRMGMTHSWVLSSVCHYRVSVTCTLSPHDITVNHPVTEILPTVSKCDITLMEGVCLCMHALWVAQWVMADIYGYIYDIWMYMFVVMTRVLGIPMKMIYIIYMSYLHILTERSICQFHIHINSIFTRKASWR